MEIHLTPSSAWLRLPHELIARCMSHTNPSSVARLEQSCNLVRRDLRELDAIWHAWFLEALTYKSARFQPHAKSTCEGSHGLWKKRWVEVWQDEKRTQLTEVQFDPY